MIDAATMIELFATNCVKKSLFCGDRVPRFHFNKGNLHLARKTSVFDELT